MAASPASKSKSELKRVEIKQEENDYSYPAKEWRINPETFTGRVHTLIHAPHAGFANYSVLIMEIKNGKIVDVQYSEPMVSEEARLRLDTLNKKYVYEMRASYPPGFSYA